MNTEIESIEMNPTEAPIATQTPGASSSTAKASRRSRYTVVTAVLVVATAGLAFGLIPRLRAQSKRVVAAQEEARPTVNVTPAVRNKSGVQLVLPGDVRAFEQTKIYARADGYLLKWNVDIGAKVQQGDVLAEIDTPELDQELNQARAALAQAQANLLLARSSAERWQRLLKQRAVSEQEVDERNSALTAREADAKASEAAVSRLEKLTSFKEVRAPFAGTITRRFVDVGALIRGGAAASALFDLAQTDTLRIHVNVPQAYLRDVAISLPAQIRVAEYPDRVFNGKIVRTSGAFDATTRTLLTEIEAPNRDGALYPGIHVDVQFALTQANPPLIVPATAVMTRSDGLQVAVVDATDAVHLQKIEVGRDLGRTIEVVAGLEEGARVITNPTDMLENGSTVQIAESTTPSNKGIKLAKR